MAERRQKMTKFMTKDAIANISRSAIRPNRIGIEFDAATGDYLFVYLFDDHAPFAVRVSSEMTHKALADIGEVIHRSSN